MNGNVTYNELKECTDDLRERIEKVRDKLNKVYMSDVDYAEKMKVSEELDLLIVEAMNQMNEIKKI